MTLPGASGHIAKVKRFARKPPLDIRVGCASLQEIMGEHSVLEIAMSEIFDHVPYQRTSTGIAGYED